MSRAPTLRSRQPPMRKRASERRRLRGFYPCVRSRATIVQVAFLTFADTAGCARTCLLPPFSRSGPQRPRPWNYNEINADRMIDPLTSSRKPARSQDGFSLVELAVVVFIIGIILTMGVGALSAARENTASSSTAQKQNAIKEALIGYLRRNSRLPCPDTNFTAPDGVENRATAGGPTTACSSRFGLVPYVTLGLRRQGVLVE